MQRLEQHLDALAAANTTVTYGVLARDLGLRMAELTATLEALMAQDAASGRPLRAVLCAARLGNGLPAPGFFQCAEALGRDCSDPAAMVAAERKALFLGAASPLPKPRDSQ
jgi:hypothetical protein